MEKHVLEYAIEKAYQSQQKEFLTFKIWNGRQTALKYFATLLIFYL